MKLIRARVRQYRNFVDSGSVETAEPVICLVGKNESGKTSFLEALYSLKPALKSTVRVDLTRDYPRWRKVRDEREQDLNKVAPIEVWFALEETDAEALREYLPTKPPSAAILHVSRTYGGTLLVGLLIPEVELAEALGASKEFQEVLGGPAVKAASIGELSRLVEARMKDEDKRTKMGKQLAEIEGELDKATALLTGKLSQEAINKLVELMPTFFYFSEYSPLPGRVDLTRLLQKLRENLDPDEQTAIALLRLVGVEGPEFMETDFETRIAELEAAANEITSQIFKYWSTNEDLIVRFEGDSETVQTPQGQTVVHRYVDIRLNDLRHQMTTNFQTRSTGFQWFFSFIVAFSEYENDPNVIILLDEPGLGLHARAQADLLRFIEERLSTSSKVIYTSHSPFTVNPKRLERVRLVEDLSTRKDPDVGAKVSADVLSVKGDTRFPLQAALGYDIAQNLFVGGYNLVVEGPSDLVFLTTMSEHLEDLGKAHLDPRFTIVPVGGADKVPTFIALLGAHVDVTVLVDSKAATNQKLHDMIAKGLLESQRLISVSHVVQIPGANVEDLFTPGEYLRMYNAAFNEELKVADLPGTDSIILRIERHRGGEFSHLRPAVELLKRRETHLAQMSNGTLERFGQLLTLLDATLP